MTLIFVLINTPYILVTFTLKILQDVDNSYLLCDIQGVS